jgi:hypothetical protein
VSDDVLAASTKGKDMSNDVHPMFKGIVELFRHTHTQTMGRPTDYERTGIYADDRANLAASMLRDPGVVSDLIFDVATEVGSERFGQWMLVLMAPTINETERRGVLGMLSMYLEALADKEAGRRMAEDIKQREREPR